MFRLDRGHVLGGLALGDGHAAGYDVASAPGVATLPRRPCEPVRFIHALDAAPIKAATGG